MKINRLKILLTLAGLLIAIGSVRAPADDPGCLDCHDRESDAAVHTVFNTLHGSLGGGDSAACTACHGPSVKHDRRGRKAQPDISFGPRWLSTLDERNTACRGCHEGGSTLLWDGSAHHEENLACTDCHQSHAEQDKALQAETAQEGCLQCHAQVRARLHLPSRHPIAEGKTACGDCHNPHGGTGDGDLHQATLNDNCLSCHQEKRGPFLWEHPPAAEDCALCHRPHGSVNERLLTARGPALCQQCHAAAFHPSVPYGGGQLVGSRANQNLLGKNCLNCHSQPHGSNHPSGARLTR